MLTFYRCVLCSSVVSKWDIIETGGCQKCAGRRLQPSNLSRWERFIQVLKHPMVWNWGTDQDIPTAEFPGHD